ncbi:MAG: AraC-like DNA-binding protein [Flavobacteriales bacterium]|jgi:AraC-like DNA-binding protein
MLAHDSVIFNLHDVVLLMAASQYVLLGMLLGMLLLFTRRTQDKSSYLLVFILLINGLYALDILLTWNMSLREWALLHLPNSLFSGVLANWMQGPLLYLYVVHLLYRSVRYRWWYVLHFVPVVLVFVYLYQVYYGVPLDQKVQLLVGLGHSEMSHGLNTAIFYSHISVMVYGVMSLYQVYRYREQLQQRFANVEESERGWLSWIIVAFVALSLWRMLANLLGSSLGEDAANIMGISGNYLSYILVNSMVFASIRYAHLFQGLLKGYGASTGDEDKRFEGSQVEAVSRLMDEEKPYLNKNINIETLAKLLGMSERTLSKILNQHFERNFFEFINAYRITEAMRLLSAEGAEDMTILDVQGASGFTSKSTFNAIFKKTPG